MKTILASLIVFCMLAVPLAALDYISAAAQGYLPWWAVIGYMMMLPLWYYVVVKALKQLVFVLPLALCVSAYAAPLPPMPVAPAVTRPAPLLSPKAMSSGAMAGAPMLRFTPASVGYDVPGLAPTLPPTFQTNLTIYQPDGSEVQRDLARLICKQRVGKGIRVECTDGTPSAAGPWEFLADWTPYVVEQIIVTERYTDPEFRPQARFYRVVEYSAPSMLRLSGTTVKPAAMKLNPAIKELRSWRMIVP